MHQVLSLLKQLGVNETFYTMFVLFACTYFVVSFLLTRPLGNLVIERDKRILGRQEEVTKIRVELSDIQTTLSDERKKAQSLASSKFSELKNSAVLDQRKILTEARDDFAKKVKETRDQVEKMFSEERQKIERETSVLKDEVVAKLLGTNSHKSSTLGKEI